MACSVHIFILSLSPRFPGVCVCVCREGAVAQGCQKRMLDTLKPALQATVVNLQAGAENQTQASSRKAASTLHRHLTPSAPHFRSYATSV